MPTTDQTLAHSVLSSSLLQCKSKQTNKTEENPMNPPYMFPTDRQPIFLKSQYDIWEKVHVMGWEPSSSDLGAFSWNTTD